jgi:DNA-binding response OmpR family regulator
LKVLLVDDDADLLDVTAYALRRKGFNVIMASDGAHALRRWEMENPDVVVLDVGLPKMNGFDVCHQIRTESGTPVILLTARADEENILQGFRSGADDYVTKPFSPAQLIMRIEAVARRGAAVTDTRPSRLVTIGDLRLDPESHEVRQGGVEVRLTPREFRILFLLASNAGRVVRGTTLADFAWGYQGGDPSLLKTHISHIRTKLNIPANGPGSIAVVPTVGYKLVPPATEEPKTKPDSRGESAARRQAAIDPIPARA